MYTATADDGTPRGTELPAAGEPERAAVLNARWAVVLPHHDRLMRIARRRLPTEQDAEDCVQDAMVRCVEVPVLDDVRAGSLLTAILLNLCTDAHRRRLRGQQLGVRLAVLAGFEPSPEDAVCDRDEAVRLARRIELLPKRQQAMVAARAEGLSCSAVASTFGVSYASVESALARARATIRRGRQAALGLLFPSRVWRHRWLGSPPVVAVCAMTVVEVVFGASPPSPVVRAPLAGIAERPGPAGERAAGETATRTALPAERRPYPLGSVVSPMPRSGSTAPTGPLELPSPPDARGSPESTGYSTLDEARYCVEHPSVEIYPDPFVGCRRPPEGWAPSPLPTPGGRP